MKTTAEFDLGPFAEGERHITCEFTLPDSWLDYLMTQLHEGHLPHYLSQFRANGGDDRPTDMRNYCMLDVGVKNVLVKAREELAALRGKPTSVQGGNAKV